MKTAAGQAATVETVPVGNPAFSVLHFKGTTGSARPPGAPAQNARISSLYRKVEAGMLGAFVHTAGEFPAEQPRCAAVADLAGMQALLVQKLGGRVECVFWQKMSRFFGHRQDARDR